MILAPWAAPDTRVSARASVKAEREAFGVHIVYHGLHAVREVVLLGIEKARSVAAPGPAVIQMEVTITSIVEANFNKGISRGLHTKLVAKIEYRVFSPGSESHPTGPT
jgi:hypothetical protein